MCQQAQQEGKGEKDAMLTREGHPDGCHQERPAGKKPEERCYPAHRPAFPQEKGKKNEFRGDTAEDQIDKDGRNGHSPGTIRRAGDTQGLPGLLLMNPRRWALSFRNMRICAM